MILDWFIGAAIRNKSRSTWEASSVFDPDNGIWLPDLIDSSNATPAILGGVRVSILFR